MSEFVPKPLRYNEGGNVHMDFHGAANTTIDFIVDRFGIEAMHEIFRKVGEDVYQDLRRHLMAGDREELVRHWRHFFEREAGDYDIAVGDDEIVLTVRRCPAWHHVLRRSPAACRRISATRPSSPTPRWPKARRSPSRPLSPVRVPAGR